MKADYLRQLKLERAVKQIKEVLDDPYLNHRARNVVIDDIRSIIERVANEE